MSKVLFFKEFGTHSFKIINLDKEQNDSVEEFILV